MNLKISFVWNLKSLSIIKQKICKGITTNIPRVHKKIMFLNHCQKVKYKNIK